MLPGPARTGIALSLLSAVGFCLMAILIRQAAGFNTFMVAQFRFVIGLALLGTAALFGRIRLDFSNGWLLFFRGLSGDVLLTDFLKILDLTIAYQMILI